MVANLTVAAFMIAATTVIHMMGLLGLIMALERASSGLDGRASRARLGVAIVGVVLGIFTIHGAQIWLYAALYLALGALGSLEEALYFSASTFTTVGFGDITLDQKWRLLSAIESANGFILIGWSTAFLINVTARLRALEGGHHHTEHKFG